jgi:hypothetical protein
VPTDFQIAARHWGKADCKSEKKAAKFFCAFAHARCTEVVHNEMHFAWPGARKKIAKILQRVKCFAELT